MDEWQVAERDLLEEEAFRLRKTISNRAKYILAGIREDARPNGYSRWNEKEKRRKYIHDARLHLALKRRLQFD